MDNSKYAQAWQILISTHRSYLISFGFRLTGSLSDAEDIVQDAFIDCMGIDPATIENHKSWLTKVCSNKGLDKLKSAYKKRETYPGTWLPDAIPESLQIWQSLDESAALPDKNILKVESLTTSFLLLVERLTPEERVVYILSEVFEYSFKEISAFLNKTDAACRKIAERARNAIASKREKFSGESIRAEALIAGFFEAAKNGDTAALVSFLAEESELWSDGGGQVPASSQVLSERNKIAEFFSRLGSAPMMRSEDFKLEFPKVNQRPGLIISRRTVACDLADEWVFDTIMSFEFTNGQIARIYAQRNPEKLRRLIKEPESPLS